MISTINFADIKNSKNFQYATQLEYFKNNTQIQFKPGLNIIFAPNGTGKSTLLKIMAQFTASEQGGVSTVTDSWMRDVGGYQDSHLNGLEVKHDGQPVMYNNPRQAVGLFGGMAGFDEDFFDQGIAEVQMKESTGMTTLARMNKVLALLHGKYKIPEKIAMRNGKLNTITEGFLQASISLGQQTVLLDEPESGLAVHVQANLWKMIEKGAKEQNLQIIVATHSPFALACFSANYLELKPGYIKLAKTCIKDVAETLKNLDKLEEMEAKILAEEVKLEAKKSTHDNSYTQNKAVVLNEHTKIKKTNKKKT